MKNLLFLTLLISTSAFADFVQLDFCELKANRICQDFVGNDFRDCQYEMIRFCLEDQASTDEVSPIPLEM